jgi:hypothetical protein
MGDPAVVNTGAGTSGRGNQPIVPPESNNAAAAVQLVLQILNNTNVTLKQEVIKLPELFCQARKDTISALTNVKSPMIETMSPPMLTFISASEEKQKNGLLQKPVNWNSLQPRKSGPGSDPFF